MFGTEYLSLSDRAARRGALIMLVLTVAAGAIAAVTLGLTGLAPTGVALLVVAVVAVAGVASLLLGAYRSDRAADREFRAAEQDGGLLPPRAALSMLEALHNPVLMVDGDERVLAANRAARVQLGHLRLGVLLSSLIRAPEVFDAFSEIVAGKHQLSVTYRTSTADEHYVRADMAAVDVGARGRAALIALYDDTETQRAVRSRVNFLANASHELRTPLASLSGFIETLRGHAKSDPEAQERFLNIMEAQAARMRGLIDDLLSLSRVEQNEHVQPKGQADLRTVMGDVTDAMAPVANPETVTLKSRLPDEGISLVVGERDELVQALQNLVSNAVKYSPAGGEVDLELELDCSLSDVSRPADLGVEDAPHLLIVGPVSSDARFAMVTVKDRGAGIPREHLPQLSDRFFRVPVGDGPIIGGTGLGLAIVKHIMNRHRGGLAVTSAVGHGTAFRLFVPHAVSQQPQQASQPALENVT